MQYLIFAALLSIAIVIVIAASYVQTNGWKDKLPPIDDDEFIARCAPGTNRDIALTLREIISEHLGVGLQLRLSGTTIRGGSRL